MGKTFVRQNQILSSSLYDDTLSFGENLETGSVTLQDDLNALRSQLKTVIGSDDWYDGLGGDGSGRNLDELDDALSGVQGQSVLFRAQKITPDITVPGGQNYVVLSVGGGEAPSEIAATQAVPVGTIGFTTGAVAFSGSVGAASLGVVPGSHSLSPRNLILIRSSSTGQVIQDVSGSDIYGLLQTEQSDGGSFGDTVGSRVQISFIKENSTRDAFVTASVADIGGLELNYSYIRRLRVSDLPEFAFIGGVFLDRVEAFSDVTLDHAVDNQIGPVTQVQDIDIQLAGVGWEFQRSDGSQILLIDAGLDSVEMSGSTFRVTSTTFDVNNDSTADFAQGAAFDTADQTINIGVTAGQIDSTTLSVEATAGDLTLSASGDLVLVDGDKAASNYTADFTVANSTTEWNDFESNYGDGTSILQAFNIASSSLDALSGSVTGSIDALSSSVSSSLAGLDSRIDNIVLDVIVTGSNTGSGLEWFKEEDEKTSDPNVLDNELVFRTLLTGSSGVISASQEADTITFTARLDRAVLDDIGDISVAGAPSGSVLISGSSGWISTFYSASTLPFDDSTSTLTSGTVQGALEEVAGRIDEIDADLVVTASNVGAGQEWFKEETVDNNLVFRTLATGSSGFISASQEADTVTVEARFDLVTLDDIGDVSATGAPSGSILISGSSGWIDTLYSASTLPYDPSATTLSSSTVQGAIDEISSSFDSRINSLELDVIVTGSNIGGGLEWFAAEDDPNNELEFRTLTTGSEFINAVQGVNTIQLDIDLTELSGAVEGILSASNLDVHSDVSVSLVSGTVLVYDGNSWIDTFYSASTIPFDPTTSDLTSGTIQGALEELDAKTMDLTTGSVTNGTNVGAGAVSIFQEKSGTVLEFRSIQTGSNVLTASFSGDDNEIILDVQPENILLDDLGDISSANAPSGSILISGSAGWITTFYSASTLPFDDSTSTLTSGTVQSALEEVAGRIDSIDADLVVTASNVGGGEEWFKEETVDNNLVFRTLVTGSDILSASTDVNTVTVDVVLDNILLSGSQIVDFTGSYQGLFSASNLEGLNNVDTSGVLSESILRWDGTNWVDAVLSASEVPFDPSTSTLTSGNVQTTFEEIAGRLDAIDAGFVEGGFNSGSGVEVFKEEDGDNTLVFRTLTSGSEFIDIVQTAGEIQFDLDITELSGAVEGILSGSSIGVHSDVDLTGNASGSVLLFNGSEWTPDVLSASIVPYNPGSSSLTSGTVQGALDEVAGRLDEIDADFVVTASNVGDGEGWFKEETAGNNLVFRTLATGSNILSASTGINTVTLDVVLDNILLSGSQIVDFTASYQGLFSASNLEGLNNVDTSGALSESILRWDGTSWVDAILSASEVPFDSSTSTLTSGNIQTALEEVVGRIDEIDADLVVTASNVGGGQEWFKEETVDNNLVFRTLVTGSNKLSASQDTNTVTLDVVLDNITLSGSQITDFTSSFTGLLSASNLDALADVDDNIANAVDGNVIIFSGGQWITGSHVNLGAGEIILSGTSDDEIRFRTITSASSKIVLSGDANELSIDVDNASLSISAEQITNISGAVEGILSGSSIDVHLDVDTTGKVSESILRWDGSTWIDALLSASNVPFDPAATTFTSSNVQGIVEELSASFDARLDAIDADLVVTASNVGGGQEWFKEETVDNNLVFRTLITGSDVLVASQQADTVTIDVQLDNIIISGSQVTDFSSSFSGLLSSSNLDALADVDAGVSGAVEGNILVFSGGQWVTGSFTNLGLGDGGEPIFSGVVGNEVRFRTLEAGPGILLGTDFDEIALSVNDAALEISASQIPDFTGSVNGILSASSIDVHFDVNTTGKVSESILRWDGSDWIDALLSASSVPYDDSVSTIPATNVQEAIEAIDARIDTLEVTGGQANTASNLGIGLGWFSQKVVDDLQFRSIATGSTEILTASFSGTDNEILIDVNLANLSSSIEGILSASSISVHSDVSVTSPLSESILRFDGSSWIDATLSASNIPYDDSLSVITGANVQEAIFALDSRVDTLEVTGGQPNDGLNVGSGLEVFKDKVGFDLRFRTILTGSGVLTASQEADTITLDVNLANLVLSSSQVFDINSTIDNRISGTNLDVLNDVSVGGAISGSILVFDGSQWTTGSDDRENTTAVNLGDGQAVFSGSVGDELRFRTIESGSNKVTLSQDANEIIIDIDDSNLTIVAEQVSNISGAVEGILSGSSLDVHLDVDTTGKVSESILRWDGTSWVDAILSASSVPFDSSTSTLTSGNLQGALEEVAGRLDSFDADFVVTASNAGGGQAWFKEETVDNNLIFRTLVTGSSVLTASQQADTVTIDVVLDNIIIDGTQISDFTSSFAGLLSSSNVGALNDVSTTGASSGSILVFDGSQWIVGVDNSENTTAINLGNGREVFSGTVGDELRFRTLDSGSNKISLTQDANEIILDVNDSNLSLSASQVLYSTASGDLTSSNVQDAIDEMQDLIGSPGSTAYRVAAPNGRTSTNKTTYEELSTAMYDFSAFNDKATKQWLGFVDPAAGVTGSVRVVDVTNGVTLAEQTGIATGSFISLPLTGSGSGDAVYSLEARKTAGPGGPSSTVEIIAGFFIYE